MCTASRYAANPRTALIRRILPGFIVSPAWRTNLFSPPGQAHFKRIRLKSGTVLSISSWRIFISGEMFPRRSTCRTASTRSRTMSCLRPPPAASQTTKKTQATIRNVPMAINNATLPSLPRLAHFKHCHREMNARDGKPFREFRPNSRGLESADHLAGFFNAALPERENILHGYDFAFHAGDFSYAGHLARAVAETSDLHNNVDSRSDLAAYRGVGNVQASHGDHRFQAAQSIPRAIGVNRRKGTIVAGVHCLQHIKCFLASHLADNDAVGPHAQRVNHELALMYSPLSFNIGRPRFQSNDVLLVELQLGRVLDGHNPFPVGNV